MSPRFPRHSGEEVVVVSRDFALPYSKGLMAQSMMASGLPPSRSYELAKRIELRLRDRTEGEIRVAELRALAEDVLAAEEGEGAVLRFRRWQRLSRLDSPLIVMLGGAAGTGKSTLATMLAHRLGVTRVSATDVIRQVLRAFFSHEFMPAVHYSSFEAGAAVKLRASSEDDPDLVGFLRQAENVTTGVRAIVERAVEERTPMVLEGVHLVPGLVPDRLAERALLVRAVLTVPDEELHRNHLWARGAAHGQRPADRYIANFVTIRKLQSYLVEQAHAAGVPVIANEALDRSLAQIMDLVLDAIAAADAAEAPTHQEESHP